MGNDRKGTDKNLDYYITHQDELVKKYNGRYIIIANEKVHGAYNTLREAVKAARNEYKAENIEYQIQLVEPGEESYTKIISRVKLHA